MGFESSKFVSKIFANATFGSSNFSSGTSGSSATGDADIEYNNAWQWEDGSYILWESNNLILLEL